MSLFVDLGLNDRLLRALEEEGYSQPTPIQSQAIGPLLDGADLLGIAQTGTGKTAAFALPILHLLSEQGHAREPKTCRVLVLAPTRELAIQVEESFRTYGRHLPLRTTCIFGGVGDAPQKAALAKGVDILVATPGRLLDLMNQGAVHFKRLEIFVLDEADRMLDMGFIHDIRKVIAILPRERQNLFFSATMPPEISTLAGTILRNPVRVEVVPASTPIERIEQSLYFIPQKGKTALLSHILLDESIEKALVFTRMKHVANRVAEALQRKGISAEAIHGNKSQTHRQKVLGGFKEGSVRILVATDIAARGIDVDGVTHVFNYDLPDVPETYVHRIGRTARAGASGIAIAFCSPDEQDELRQIEKVTRRRISEQPFPPGFDPAAIPAAGPSDENKPDPRQRGRNNRPQRPQGNKPQGSPQGQSQGRPQGSPQGRPQNSQQGASGAPRNSSSADRQPQNVRHDSHDPRDQWYGAQRGGQNAQGRSQQQGGSPEQGAPRRRKNPRNRRPADGQPDFQNRKPGVDTHGGGAGLMGKIQQGIGKIFGR